MLSNTLSIIETTAKRQLNKNINYTELLCLFKHYKKDMWIYPGILKRKFSLSLLEIYDFLEDLEKQGVLQSYYELYCSKCQKSMGMVRLFNELPNTFECEICHREFSALENSFLIYMVMRDD